MNKIPGILLAALGLTAVSAVIIFLTHCFWLRPLWSYAPLAGVEGTDADDLKSYEAMLLGAIGTAGLGFNAWIFGISRLWRERLLQGVAPWLKLWPGLLLVPVVVHYWGMKNYRLESIRVNQELVAKYRAQRHAVLPAAIPANARVQSTH